MVNNQLIPREQSLWTLFTLLFHASNCQSKVDDHYFSCEFAWNQMLLFANASHKVSVKWSFPTDFSQAVSENCALLIFLIFSWIFRVHYFMNLIGLADNIALQMVSKSVHSVDMKIPNKFNKAYWNAKSNGKLFLDWLGSELGFKHLTDWYNITEEDIESRGGTKLLAMHNRSPLSLVTEVYSNHDWIPFKFSRKGKHFWREKSNHRGFFDWLGKELGFETHSDWYKVTLDDVLAHGGRTLLKEYHNSLQEAVMLNYPEVEWIPWKFNRRLHILNQNDGFWNDMKHHKLYFGWLAKELEFHDMEEWYSVTQERIKENYGSALLTIYNGSPYRALKAVFSGLSGCLANGHYRA